jgi:hypothetical protein
MKKIVVRQIATKMVSFSRDVILEVPSGFPHAEWRLQSLVEAGAQEYGPFSFQPTPDSEQVEVTSTYVVGETDLWADVPYRPGSRYGALYRDFQQEFQA